MADKKAFVFDTNFIIQNPKLDEVIEKLKDDYTVYISQVSIDERIAQQCRELKKEFDEIESCKNKYSRYVKMSMKTTYEKQAGFYCTGIQERYSSCFGDNIIPFDKSGETLERIIERANKKEPPFSCNKDASDKGFKDCLLWLSILDYFKEKGEDKVVFLTDDKHAFRNFIDFLSDEFESETGKVIEFKPNSYYKELFKKVDSTTKEKEAQKESVPNIEEFRIEVENVIDSLRCIYYENYYGDPQWDRTFTTSVQFDKEYVKTLFEGLHEFIVSHIFEKSVSATKIFAFDGRISDGNIEIPLKNLESAFELYQKVITNYPQYQEQFFEAASKILNQNYVAPNFFDIKDDDLPF